MATLVDDGLEYLAKLANGVSTDPFTDIALGSGTGSESTSASALGSELTSNGLARATATCTYPGTNQAKWSKQFTATADDQAVNEIAVFNTGNKMLMIHEYSSTKNLDTDESILVEVVFTQSRST